MKNINDFAALALILFLLSLPFYSIHKYYESQLEQKAAQYVIHEIFTNYGK